MKKDIAIFSVLPKVLEFTMQAKKSKYVFITSISHDFYRIFNFFRA